jgi:replicative DNA helicase
MTPARRRSAASADSGPLTAILNRVDGVTEGQPSSDSIASGFPSLDRALGGGFRRGDLAVLGGDVGSGKSALALAIALRAAARHSVLALSSEMLPERVMERVLAIEGRVRIDDLRRGSLDETARANVAAVAVRLRDQLPRVVRLPAVEDAIPKTWSRAEAPDLLIVDSLQGLAPGLRELAEEQATAVRRLKTLALEAGIAILATSQLPQLSTRADRRPQLDDFGALGAVKHHADVVLGLYREAMYDTGRDVEGATELLIRKNRHGGGGYVDLFFYAPWMRFEDMLDPDR